MSSHPARSTRYHEASTLKLYPPPGAPILDSQEECPGAEPGLEALEERLKRIPVSVGALLVVLGVADMAIPFTPLLGTTMLGLGCVNICAHTNTLGRLDRWLARRAPRARDRIVVTANEMLHFSEEFGARFRTDMAARYAE